MLWDTSNHNNCNIPHNPANRGLFLLPTLISLFMELILIDELYVIFTDSISIFTYQRLCVTINDLILHALNTFTKPFYTWITPTNMWLKLKSEKVSNYSKINVLSTISNSFRTAIYSFSQVSFPSVISWFCNNDYTAI